MEKKLSEAIASYVVTHPTVFVVMGLLFLVTSGLGLKNVSMMPDIRVFFSENNPDKIELDYFENSFSKEDTGLIALVPEDGKVFTQEFISAVDETVNLAWQLSYVRRVDSITNFQNTESGEGDSIRISDLIENASTVSHEQLKIAKDSALSRVELVGSIINPSATMTLIRAVFLLPGEDPRSEAPHVYHQMQDIKHAIEASYPEIELKISGTVAMNANFTLAARKDLKTLVPLMIVSILIIAGLLLRMISAAFMILLVILISSISAIGALSWMGIPLNTATVMAPLIISILTLAGASHLLVGIQRSMVDSPSFSDQRMRKENIIKVLGKYLPVISLSMVTTIIGFLSLNFSISPPFQQLGNTVAIGLGVSLFLTLTFIPALFILFPFGKKAHPIAMDSLCKKIPNLLFKAPLITTIFLLIISLLLISGFNKLRLEDNFIAYFDKSFSFRNDTDFIEKNITGLRTLEYPFFTDESNGIYNPNFLNQVSDFVDWIRQHPKVASVQSPTDTLKRLAMNMNNDDTAFYRIPETPEEAAQFMLLYEMSLGYGFDLTDRLTLDKSGVRVTVVLRDVTTYDTRKLESEIENWISSNTPLLSSNPTGIAHVFTLLAFRDAKTMLAGTALALISISLLIALVLKNWRLGLISLIPNLFPAILAFSLWGHISGQITLAVSVVAAMTFGIIVDDTIHFMMEFSRQRKKGMCVEKAIRNTFENIGSALIITSIALVVGFAIMSMSGFAVNSDMAFLSMITIFVALLCDLVLLPVLLLILPDSFTRLRVN